MCKSVRFYLILSLCGGILAFLSPDALSSAYQLNVAGGRISAEFEKMSLSAIIADVGAKTGIQFIFLGGAAAAGYESPFSFKSDSLPIRSAIEKLLRNFNYSLISDGNDNIRKVYILGSKSVASSGQRTQPPSFQVARQDADRREEPSQDTPDQEEREAGSMRAEGLNIEDPNAAAEVESPPISADSNIPSAGAGRVATNARGAKAAPRAAIRKPGRWTLQKR